MVKIAVIPGDGIGPEIVNATLRVLNSLNLDLEYEFFHIGYGRLRKTGEAISDDDIEAIKEIGIALMGPVTTPKPSEVKKYRSPVLTLRRELDLYVNLRPVKSLPNIPQARKNVDMIIVRENVEGLYYGIEKEFNDGYSALLVVTKKNTERLAEFTFKYARGHGRRKVTVVHKANVLRKTHGLFLRTCLNVAKKYPEIKVEEMHVDTASMLMVLKPENFDIIVTTNMFGDILSGIGSALIGSPGLMPSANIGDKYAIFAPAHGSAPDIAGKNIANPIAMMLSAKMMLEKIGFPSEAEKLERAIIKTLKANVKTPDIGGKYSTTEFTNAVIRFLRECSN